MTTLNRPTPHDPSTASTAHAAALDSPRRPSAQLILDAVVASYIHDISERHPHPQIASDRTAASGTSGS